jgi:methylenetetrahydrofolate reductase (NADPH)
MSARPFEIVCEIEPPVRPDLTHARHQIGVLTAVSSTFLIPDNHIGRATVSSIAVAHEVQAMGGHAIACINSRDRNLLGFRRDLLTAAAYGVSQFLFVYGDKPDSGTRTSDLTVRSMIEEARSCTAANPAFAGLCPPLADRRRRRPAAAAPVEARRRLHLQPGQLFRRRPAPLA